MKKILIFLLGITILFASTDASLQKELSSENRASTHLENLVFDGYFDKAEQFAKFANDKYKNSADILCWTGKLYFEKKDLENAKVYFHRALAVDNTHEMSKEQLKLIEDQEAALKNENVENILALLEDKGLDYILIFLGFLGAEIISKRYAVCQNHSVYTHANNYIRRKKLVSSLSYRIKSVFTNITAQNFSLICILINILVLITLSLAMLVPFLFIEFYYEVTLFMTEPFIIMSSAYIEQHFWYLFLMLFTLTFIFFNLAHAFELPKKEVLYEIEIVEELDALIESGEYSDIYEVLQYLQNNGISKDELHALVQRYSLHTDEILQFC